MNGRELQVGVYFLDRLSSDSLKVSNSLLGGYYIQFLYFRANPLLLPFLLISNCVRLLGLQQLIKVFVQLRGR